VEKVPVISWSEIPADIREEIKESYAETSDRPILNDSYHRFPYLFDLNDDLEYDIIKNWFYSTFECHENGYFIIHFDW
jgi:hypothetical protein